MKIWCRRAGLNCRPQPYQDDAPQHLVATQATGTPHLATCATVFPFHSRKCAHYVRDMEMALTPYMVRMAETHEAVGIFVAHNADALWWMIDEACPPNLCEYRILPPGGVLLEGQTTAKWPNRVDEFGEIHPDDCDEIAGAGLSESWATLSIDDLTWLPVSRPPRPRSLSAPDAASSPS